MLWKCPSLLQLSSSASPLSRVSAWGTLFGHGHTRHLLCPVGRFSLSAWRGGSYFTGVSSTHYFEKGCMCHGGISKFPAPLSCLSSSLRCLLSAEAPELSPWCCLLKGNCEHPVIWLSVGGKSMDILAGSEGDPGCRWVLLALVRHGTTGLWGAKPVYPNVSRELGGHTVIATPVLSDHHGSSSQRDPVTRPQGLAMKNTLLPGSCWGVSLVCWISHFGGEWSLSQAGWVEELALGGGSIVILMGLLRCPPYTRTHL